MSKSMDDKVRNQLIERFLDKKERSDTESVAHGKGAFGRAGQRNPVPEEFTRFDHHPGYETVLASKTVAEHLGLTNPFFRAHDGVAGATTHINGRQFINFSNYNYLGLAGHPDVNRAAQKAIDRYGTSASASRLVAGERPVQRELEEALADLHGVDDCVVFVSGHATNVSTIGYLFGPRDLVIHDSLIHNSVLEGIRLSGAARRSFEHNDMKALDQILLEIRGQFERVLIVAEGLYSMDGDIADVPALINIKRRHKAFLMIDEAHSLGILGKTGKGVREHFGVDGRAVDIWMGTLSKTLASCGGYIAGERALVEHLKYAAPGFVYSVGIAPSLAAASLEALRIMLREPVRVERLRERTGQLLRQMQTFGINTGLAQGYGIVSAMIGDSIKAAQLSNHCFEAGINVQPVIYPAVAKNTARLRFFLSSMHTENEIEYTGRTLERLMGSSG